MKNRLHLETLLTASGKTPNQQIALFALLNLGIVESLVNGLLSPTEALQVFYHAENCLFVRTKLRKKPADEIMSRGVQLPDLFEVLPSEDIQREFQKELTAMRGMCLKLLATERRVA